MLVGVIVLMFVLRLFYTIVSLCPFLVFLASYVRCRFSFRFAMRFLLPPCFFVRVVGLFSSVLFVLLCSSFVVCVCVCIRSQFMMLVVVFSLFARFL